MGESLSLLTRFTAVVGQVGSILSGVDIDLLDRSDLKLVGTIKRLMQDARLDIRDYEVADSREEMQRYAREALKRLEQAREAVLAASEHDIFSAIEVADITARFEHVAAELQRSV